MEKYPKQFTTGAKFRSISYAMQGIIHVIRNEHNARIHLVSAVVVTAMGIMLHINYIEWIMVILCIGLVIAAETINTAIEKLTDLAAPFKNEQSRMIKDISAGAVLIISGTALVTGLIIFVPYLFRLL